MQGISGGDFLADATGSMSPEAFAAAGAGTNVLPQTAANVTPTPELMGFAQPPSEFVAARLPEDAGFLAKLASPSRPAFVDPVTNQVVAGELNPLGIAGREIGTAMLGEAISPQPVPDFLPATDDGDERKRRAERLANRATFSPSSTYRAGIDPEFEYFGRTRFLDEPVPAANGGPVKMNLGGGLPAIQASDPSAAGLGAVTGLMTGADPDSSMMQIQSMMMEGSDPVEISQEENNIIEEAMSAIRGEHPRPEQAIEAFVSRYGEEALNMLVEAVKEEMAFEETGGGQVELANEGFGLIDGPGGGRDDLVPATLKTPENDKKEYLLSRGEFLLPSDVVSGIGDGSSSAGEEELMALIDRVRTRRTGTKEPPNMVGDVLPA